MARVINGINPMGIQQLWAASTSIVAATNPSPEEEHHALHMMLDR